MTAAPPPNRPKINDNDTELIQAINSGQTEKFPELVRRYEQKLYNFGRRMCGDATDAEDLVQDTFLNVFRYLKDFRRETKFKNWLYRVAASTGIKKRRHIEAHVADCLACFACLQTLKQTVALCRQAGDRPVPAAFFPQTSRHASNHDPTAPAINGPPPPGHRPAPVDNTGARP